jgi:hypothetical protein
VSSYEDGCGLISEAQYLSKTLGELARLAAHED